MISEMPLPMPRSEICSPSHMMNAVPVVSVMIVMNRNAQPGFGTTIPKPPAFELSSQIEIPNDCTSDSRTVPNRVYCVIFFRPASPSLLSFSRYGQTTVRSCRMIDAVMYGMIPRAKIVSLEKFPPENMSTKPRIEPPLRSNIAFRALASTPGVGI